ncbi:MAG: hypothetical protein HY235_11125 [Acidobacteria bacterium]|nr:hypothetical protein [Acidobacteriota bacterium]
MVDVVDVTVTKGSSREPSFPWVFTRPRGMLRFGEGLFWLSPFALMREFAQEIHRNFGFKVAEVKPRMRKVPVEVRA